MIHFLDPYTMQIIEMSGQYYFQYEEEMTFFSLKAHGKEFTVSPYRCKSIEHIRYRSTT